MTMFNDYEIAYISGWDPISRAKTKLRSVITKHPWAAYFSNLTLETFLKTTHTQPFLGTSLRGLLSLHEGYVKGELTGNVKCVEKLNAYHHTGKDEITYYYNKKIFDQLEPEVQKIEVLYEELNAVGSLAQAELKVKIEGKERILSILVERLSNVELMGIRKQLKSLSDEKDVLIKTLSENKKNTIKLEDSLVKLSQSRISELVKEITKLEKVENNAVIKLSKEQLIEYYTEIEKLKRQVDLNSASHLSISNRIFEMEKGLKDRIDDLIDRNNFDIEAKLYYVRQYIRTISHCHVDDMRIITRDLIEEIGKTPVTELDIPGLGKISYEYCRIDLDRKLEEIYKESCRKYA